MSERSPSAARAIVAVVLLTAFAVGAATSRMAPHNPTQRADIPWVVLCAPSYFAAVVTQGFFRPFPFSVPFGVANGVLYAFYAALALTLRRKWLLLAIPFVHAVCGYLIIVLAGISGIRG